MVMNEVLTYLAERLRSHYARVVRQPMPWRMIDALSNLEETLEQRVSKSVRAPHDDHSADGNATSISPRDRR
jgi:hypothetical protein